nr:hypothetical protein [Tanacetum cinerariifolium]
MADSHTGNHPEDDFTPLETIRRSYSVIRERIPFELEGETFEPERGGTSSSPPVKCNAYGGEPSVDLLRSFLNLGRAGSFFYIENKIIPSKYPELLEDNKLDKKSFKDKILVQPQTDPLYAQISTYPCVVRTFSDPILYLAGLKTSWEYSPKRPVIYHRGQEMDFRSFMIQGVDGEFNFLPEGGFEDNQGYFSTKSVNNETHILDAEPISVVLPANVADNIIDSCNTSFDDELHPVHPPTSSFPEVGEKSKVVGKRKLVVDALRDGSHRRARRAPVQASKVTGDASTPLDVDSDPDIHGHPVMPFEREVKRDKAYDELEKKCNEALQDLDKNPFVSDMRSVIETLEGQVNGLHNEYGRLLIEERKWANYGQTLRLIGLRQDRAAVVSKFVPDAAMKLVHSDEMGVLISRLVRAAIVHGRCTAFEEIAKLKEPFVLEKMSGYRMSSKDEYDRAGEDMFSGGLYP